MKILKYLIVVELLFNICNYVAAQWCIKSQYVVKTRIQWNNGERMVSKRTFFGTVKYKYEPYLFSTTEYYHDYEKVSVCCDGYTNIGDTKCEPQCKPPCPTNTQCTRPNVCACNHGYVGYSTHPSMVTCQPVCSPACPENSRCLQPNTCNCNEGYEKMWDGSCQPVCNPSCPENSKCAQPNNCICNQGYEYNNASVGCQPKCINQCPLNSICLEPNKCTCLAGYKMVDNQCEAICEPGCLENAICTKPNQCECLEGYEMDRVDDSSWECVPKCTDDCPEHSFCAKPNSCECQTGYEQSSNNTTCNPICQPNCLENSICSAPNSCACLKGYHMLDTLDACHPICDKPCPDHSVCAKPNKCECLAGYQMKLSSMYNIYCEPYCQKNCSTFGKCVQPNKCECLSGYEMDEVENCRPTCSQGCSNGLCYIPEVCICNPGYLMGPHNNCEPACSMPCENGSCVEPEICQCTEGYKLRNGSVNVCEPQCEPECVNGMCVDPNVCICEDGYEPVDDNHSNCQSMRTTTAPELTTEYELSYTEAKTISFTTPLSTTVEIEDFTTEDIPEQVLFTTTSPSTEPWLVCQDFCQCWQESDELGSLSTKSQCINECVDEYDKPCLNLSLCHCDALKLHLICQSEDYPEEDPFVYECKIKRLQLTTSKSIEMQSSADQKDSSYLWIILTSILGVGVLAAVGVLLYRKYNNNEDLILEYEL